MQNSKTDIIKLMVMNTILSGNLFFFAARSTAWPDEENPPSTGSTSQAAFENEYLFLKRVDMRDARFMVARNNWASGNKTAGTIWKTQENRVYLCKTSGTSTSRPMHLSGDQAAPGGGTAVWSFLEELSADDITYFMTEALVPLSMKSERVIYGALPTKVKIRCQIIGDEGGLLPLTRKFRVIGLHSNPFNRAVATDTSGFADQVKLFGRILTYETIEAYVRAEDQVDSFVFLVDLY